MGMFAPNHILLVLLIVLLLFGGKKIPELMRGIGKGMRDFKEAKDTDKEKKEEQPLQK